MNKFDELVEAIKQRGIQETAYENAKLTKQNNDLRQRITRAIEYIGNKNIGIPKKTREKAIKILRGLDDE